MEDEHWCAWNNKHAKCEHLQRSLHSETIACLVPDWVPVKFCSETAKQNNVKHIHLPQHCVGMFLVLTVILPLFQVVGWWTYGSVCPFKWDTRNARSYFWETSACYRTHNSRQNVIHCYFSKNVANGQNLFVSLVAWLVIADFL